jgi:magnesium-transporting ATPase (P-type)
VGTRPDGDGLTQVSRQGEDGLTTAEAHRRLEVDGPNRLPQPPKPSRLRRFARQLVHFFALLLWGACLLAVLGGLPELSAAIAIVVLLNAVFAYNQEAKATRAAERLRDMLPQTITVRRDGAPAVIDAVDVVVGDLLVLEAGDRIPADGVIVAASALQLDTSLLTGESATIRAEAGDAVHAGTFVVEGIADAVVEATGGSTRLATIARLTTATGAPSSPLTLELRRVVRTIAWIAVGVGASFFAITLLLGTPLAEGFVFGIGVTVALVPEALLPTVTLSLAWAAERMAERNVLVRNLDAVETLGSTTFVCTDKTGTLTRNEMTVVHAWTPDGDAVAGDPGYDPAGSVVLSTGGARASIQRLAGAARASSTGLVQWSDGAWRPHGDPMEAAIDVFARRVGLPPEVDRRATTIDARFPFDPRRRRASVVAEGRVAVKGAPDAVLPLCDPIEGATEVEAALTARGLRVLAVAGRPWPGDAPATAEEAEAGLELYGLLGLQDPPRLEVQAAISSCRTAGIKVGMVTGDHPETARAIAEQVGLWRPGAPVVVGSELPPEPRLLGALLDIDGIVVARVSPEQKLAIAQALRARGHVVAMTGDGVNDGPALHEADIGVAMGRSGTDVARESADLVLLDDDFSTIVTGIEMGRGAFLNIRRFLTYHLTDNVAELTPFVVWAVSGSRIPLALGVLQILALDIGTDTLPAVALGGEPPSPHALARPPVRGRLLDSRVLRRAFGVLGPTEAVLSFGAFLTAFWLSGWRPGDAFPGGATLQAASGAAFMTVVAAQCANAFACRSSSQWAGAKRRPNRLLPLAVLVGLGISLVMLLWGPLARQLGHAPPPALAWVVILAAPVVLVAVDAIEKRWTRGRSRRRAR